MRAHNRSDFTEDRKKPNSLVYYQDTEAGRSYWVTYDEVLDDWTQGYLGETPDVASKFIKSVAGSKYNTRFRYAAEAPSKEITPFDVRLEYDTISGTERHVSFTIKPKREVTELFVYADTTYTYTSLQFNGNEAHRDPSGNVHSNVYNKRLMRYYLSEGDSLNISYTTSDRRNYEFTVLEYSFDLLKHPKFTINKRPATMMPKPFINTDAVLVKRNIRLDELVSGQTPDPEIEVEQASSNE